MNKPTKSGHYWVKRNGGDEEEIQGKWLVVYYCAETEEGEPLLYPVERIGSDCPSEIDRYIEWIPIPEPS